MFSHMFEAAAKRKEEEEAEKAAKAVLVPVPVLKEPEPPPERCRPAVCLRFFLFWALSKGLLKFI